jgi:very-short-patch-repair endonuclease
LAEEQHGVVARSQLTAFGLSEDAIGRRQRAGRLHRIHAGVYAVGHGVLSKEGRWMAAVLFGGRGAVLSHRSAAALWEIRGSSNRAIEITVAVKSRSRGPVERHFSVLAADEVTVEWGIPVTTVPRTIFDLAAVAPASVEGALRQAEYLRLHDRLSLWDLLDRYPRRSGARAVREALARRREASGQSRSWLEERFLPFLDRHRLPRPRLNAWVEAGGRSLQVDCLWPGARLVVELDGFAAHGTRVAFREDRARDRKLRVAGYWVTRIAPEQLDEEPDDLARDISKLLCHYKRP